LCIGIFATSCKPVHGKHGKRQEREKAGKGKRQGKGKGREREKAGKGKRQGKEKGRERKKAGKGKGGKGKRQRNLLGGGAEVPCFGLDKSEDAEVGEGGADAGVLASRPREAWANAVAAVPIGGTCVEMGEDGFGA
jgi:hypothetical protein